MIQEIAADVLLGLAAATVLASALGILVMRGVYRKLHYVTPAALVAPALVALAVFVRQGVDENTGETLLAVAFMVIAGPFLTHATIRAARIRDQGDWRGRPGGPAPPSRPARTGLAGRRPPCRPAAGRSCPAPRRVTDPLRGAARADGHRAGHRADPGGRRGDRRGPDPPAGPPGRSS